MKNNYLKNSQVNENALLQNTFGSQGYMNRTYHQANSYVLNDEEQTISTIYIQLPEEYDVFSNIDCSLSSLNDTDQHRFLSQCLQYLKVQLYKLYTQYGIVQILPKLNVASDEDGAIILNWAYANYRIYFNFEKEIKNSYYGIVAQNAEDTVFTKTGKLSIENYCTVINVILDFVMDNS